MGDVSAEPSMEDILSSIKRIIAEESDTPGALSRRNRPPAAIRDADEKEVLELSERLGEAEPAPRISEVRPFDPPSPEPVQAEETSPMPEPLPAAPRRAPEPLPVGEAILSPGAELASRGSLEALSRLIVRPEVSGGDTLEGLVREMLRPMLREWLDANLPAMVEDMVSREIGRITGRG